MNAPFVQNRCNCKEQEGNLCRNPMREGATDYRICLRKITNKTFGIFRSDMSDE